jgi:hypothetical protein
MVSWQHPFRRIDLASNGEQYILRRRYANQVAGLLFALYPTNSSRNSESWWGGQNQNYLSTIGWVGGSDGAKAFGQGHLCSTSWTATQEMSSSE